MAQTVTLEGLRSQILVSLFGRRLGFDSNDYLLGTKGVREPVQSLTSATTATTVTFGGHANIASATGTIPFSLAAPVPGVVMTLFQSATAGGIVTLASGSFVTTAGSTATAATFTEQGDRLVIVGLTTALAAVLVNEPRNPTSAASTAMTPGVGIA